MTGWEFDAAAVLDSPTARAAAAVVRCRGPVQSRDRIADRLDQYADRLAAANDPNQPREDQAA